MKMGNVYRIYFKNNLFIRIILLFACITIITILTLSYLMYSEMSQSIVRNELENQRQAMESVNKYIDEKYNTVQSMISDVYRDQLLAQNIYYLLKHPYQDYIRFRLDQYYSNENAASANALEYFRNKLDRDSDIHDLIVYSAESQHMYAYDRKGLSRLIQTNSSRSYIPDVMAMNENGVTVPNPWVRNAIGEPEPLLYSVRSPINDISTLKNIGQLVVYFDSGAIRKALASYQNNLKGYILVLTPDGHVIFDSSDKYYGKVYPYAGKINSLYKTALLEEQSYITTLTQNTEGYTVVGVAPIREVAAAYRGLEQTIITISAVCILVAIIIPALFVINFAKRTNNIIRFMRKVETGDLTARIQEDKEDELGQISKSINDMLDELVRYIDRVYKAEIKQKHTELAALQARVNPHFLYNTLEVIRMRAVSQGVKDVGEMIYSLSVLFRNLVEPKTLYTLRDEIEACRLYLELFRIRYKDKFTYNIEWDGRFADKRIIRMLLQPIIENYIVHGLEANRSDNRVTIRVEEDDGLIRIRLQDNGRGISPDKLLDIRQSLKLPETDGGSFGLHSVHERLKLLYGGDSGVQLESGEGTGTTVTLWFPAAEGEYDYHV